MFTLTNLKVNGLQVVSLAAILMILAVFGLASHKGGSEGAVVAFVELAYLVIACALAIHLKRHWGKLPAVVASSLFWGGLLVTLICFISAVLINIF